MAKKKDTIPQDKNIINISIEEAMPENYLPYAVEVAKDRALPDVRDGLKPVHRRILYGAHMLKAFPDRPYYKSARIVGDILGKFHPHGDASVYDAMVILAQDFSTRAPLIEGHGNFGSIDGDSAAAMRYTEARMSPIAMEMLKDIDKDTVDMVPNYSDSEMEPKVLPARYPNLLVNGAFGIAVGLATNIPPHNLGEVIDGTCALIDNPELDTKGLMEYIKAPDLPTGGKLIGAKSLLSAYETGEGKVAYRAKTHIETLENGRLGIVIDEFPYRRNKAKLLQTISEMTADKKHSKALELITDIRDESDRTGIRAVIEFKKTAEELDVDKVLKYLFKKTDLQCNISFNMVAIANGRPETLGLKAILEHYIAHQKEVVTRRTVRELEIAKKRFHIVEGFIKAINIIDDVIATIRNSKSKKDSIINLCEKFEFTEPQATAIVELMLYRLTGLEIKVFEKEYKELARLIKKLEKILNKESELLKVIKSELIEVKDKFNTPRRTAIIEDDDLAKIDVAEITVSEDVVVTQSNDGFVKRIPLKSFNRINGDGSEIEYRDGDFLKHTHYTNTQDLLLLFTESGNMYQVRVNNIPEEKWKEKGVRLSEILKNNALDDETILASITVPSFEVDKEIIFVTKQGSVKRTALNSLATNYTKTAFSKFRKDDTLMYFSLEDRINNTYKFKVSTEKGLSFSTPDLSLEALDKNITPPILISVLSVDGISSIERIETEKETTPDIYVGFNSDNILHINNKPIVNKDNSYKLNNNDYVFVVTEKATVFNIPGYMLQTKGKVNLNTYTDEKIISVFVVNESEIETKGIYFFTENGTVKKTAISEFINCDAVSGYKFKDNDDIKTILTAFVGELNNTDLYFFTDDNLCLKFKDECFTSTLKNAGGIVGIKLKDNKTIFGFAKSPNTNYELYINDSETPFDVDSIEYRNKSTRGVKVDFSATSFIVKNNNL